MKSLKLIAIIVTSFFCISIGPIHELIARKFFDGSVVLKVPEDFTIMHEEMLKQKYASQMPPQLVYTNKDGSTNVALNLTELDADNAKLKEYHKSIIDAYNTGFNTITWIDKGITTFDDRHVAYMEVILPTLDGDTYNLVFITHVNNKLLFCSFNCKIQEQDIWLSTAKEIMASIELND